MHLLFVIIKRLVMSLCMLYTFDLIVGSVGVLVPINVITITTVAVLGIPSVFGFLVLQNFI